MNRVRYSGEMSSMVHNFVKCLITSLITTYQPYCSYTIGNVWSHCIVEPFISSFLFQRIRSLCRPTRDWGQRLDALEENISNGELPPDDATNQLGTNVVQTESMNVLKHNSGLLQQGVNPMEETEAAAEMFVTGR